MGLAASQARMLLLVARKSDLEYRGQMINQQRLKISTDTEAVAKDYSDALSNRILKVKVGEDFVNIQRANIISAGFTLVATSGNTLGPADEGWGVIEQKIRNGIYKVMSKPVDEVKDPISGNVTTAAKAAAEVNTSTNTSFKDELNTEDDAAAEAEYTWKSATLQTQDKKLELELKNVDTQHSAIQTEVDAVKKVIDKNVETSFKTFG